MWYIETIIVSIVGMLTIISAIMGFERMIRIIMWNYLITGILLGMSNFFEMVSKRLLTLAEKTTWRLSTIQQISWEFFLDGKPTLLLTIYALLLLFLVRRAQLGIWEIRNEGLRWILTLICIPSTVLSIMLGIATAIFWHRIMDLQSIELIAKMVDHNEFLYQFVLLTPVWLILPGLFIIVTAAFVLRHTDEIIRRDVAPPTPAPTHNPYEYEQEPLIINDPWGVLTHE